MDDPKGIWLIDLKRRMVKILERAGDKGRL
jgi:hypothetical protein